MNSSSLEPRQLRVVCLGDSITGPKPRMPYRQQYLKFADLLELMLEARLGPGGAKVLNRGWAGQNSSEGLARLQEDVLDERADIAVVLLGGNDRNRAGVAVAPEETRRNLEEIYSRCRNAQIRVLALQYPYLAPKYASTGWHWLVRNNELIAEVAELVGVARLDMGPVFERAVAAIPREELVNEVDGVHLNPGGEMEFARAIFARFDELGWV